MMNVEITMLWEMTSCSLVGTNVSESSSASIFGVEDSGSYEQCVSTKLHAVITQKDVDLHLLGPSCGPSRLPILHFFLLSYCLPLNILGPDLNRVSDNYKALLITLIF
jgi:hypothetical protein